MKKRTISTYWKETIKNKICAVVLVLASSAPLIVDRDGTCMLFALILALPLFFAKENHIN